MKIEQDPKLSPGASLDYQQRHERGRAARRLVPRGSHAQWAPTPDRPDPVDLLEAQARDRIQELLPIRYGRMMASPFAFLRGSAIVMANDLAGTPKSGIQAQLCGDAHLLNFGAYASPERALLFDLNDFDETLPGPWEWDVKRLAASFVVAGRDNGFDAADCRDGGASVRGLLPATDGRVLGDGGAGGLVLAHWRGGSPWSAHRSQGWEKDHEKTEQERAKDARPRQPAGPLQADHRRRWTPDDKRRPAAPGPHPRRG